MEEGRQMIILINGPPGSGKDTIGHIMYRLIPFSVKYKIARPLKRSLQALLDINDKLWATYLDSEWKDTPFDAYPEAGTSPRQALIELSEGFAKRLFGQDIFGHIAVRAIKKLAAKHIIITDTGFIEEVRPIIHEYRPANIRILQIERPGYSYANDSRDYLDIDALDMRLYWNTLDNAHDLDILEAQVKNVLIGWKLYDRT